MASGFEVITTKSFEGSSHLVRHSGSSAHGRASAPRKTKRRGSFVTISPPTRAWVTKFDVSAWKIYTPAVACCQTPMTWPKTLHDRQALI